jgi:hypothetical protein
MSNNHSTQKARKNKTKKQFKRMWVSWRIPANVYRVKLYVDLQNYLIQFSPIPGRSMDYNLFSITAICLLSQQ